MIEANIRFFSNIISSLDDDLAKQVKDEARYVATDDSDKNWLKKVSIVFSFRFSRDTYALQLRLDDEDYLCLVNVIPPEKDPPLTLHEVSANPGLITVLGANGYLTPAIPRQRQLEILDGVLYDIDMIAADFNGYQWSDISKWFPPVLCYRIDLSSEDAEIQENRNLFYQILSQIAYEFRLHSNPFTKLSLDVWEKVIYEETVSRIEFKNLFLSFTALTWDISYLYLYQCLEDKFACEAVRGLYRRLDLSIGECELNKILYDELSWQPKDLDAIRKLIEGIGPTSPGRRFISDVADGESIEKYLYSLRNSVVHETRETRIPSDDNIKWEKVIAGMLYFLIEL